MIEISRKNITRFNHAHLLVICLFFAGLLPNSTQAQTYRVEQFGAKAGTETDNAKAIQEAIDECHKNGGGIVAFTEGVYLSGTFQLKSHVSLQIAYGSTLKAIADTAAIKKIQSSVLSRMDVVPWKAFIHADTQTNIHLFGGGTIDGSGDAPVFLDGIENSPNRAYGIHFINCEKVTVQNLNLRSSAFWMQRYFNCKDVRLEGLNVFNHANKNNDGIDIDSSEDVRISNCIIDSSDDAIVIKSEGEHLSKNIVVTDCIVATHASAIKLGTGSVGGFENIVISNIIIRRSKSEKMLHPLGVWEGLTGIDLITTDGGPMRQVIVSNITMEDVQNPIHIRLGNRLSGSVARQGYGGTGDQLQGVRDNDKAAQIKNELVLEDILLSNILCKNTGPHPIIIAGHEGQMVERITLRDVTVVSGKAGTQEDIDAPINWKANGYPVQGMYGTNLPVYGLITYYTKDMVIENFKAFPAEGEVRQEQLHLFRF